MTVISNKRRSGFVFTENGKIFRQINAAYKDVYDFLHTSGLYKKLVEKEYIVPHEEVELDKRKDKNFYKFIKPKMIEFISYPYEWCFSQLKDAALLTLNIQKTALEHGLCLKEASAYNIQFENSKPVLIDTMAFEIYKFNSPWVAYKQFCKHFLAPLAMMSYTDVRLCQLLKFNIDGIPLDMCCNILPLKAKLNIGLANHLYKIVEHEKKEEHIKLKHQQSKMTLNAQKAMLNSLIECIKSLKFPLGEAETNILYKHSKYSDKVFFAKKEIIAKYIEKARPKVIWDLGANRGKFSRIASDNGIFTVAFDIDPIAVERNYLHSKKAKERYMLPLLQDVANPSVEYAVLNNQKHGFLKRANADLIMALSLINHLAITNGISYESLAPFFKKLAPYLIIEFVPKNDDKVQAMIPANDDIFDDYNQENFESIFLKSYDILEKENVEDTERYIYLMKVKEK